MPPTLDPTIRNEPKQKLSPLGVLLLITALAVLVASIWFVSREPIPPRPAAQATDLPPMDARASQYLQKLRIENITLSRAENFIHQEVTILSATVTNSGSQAVHAVQVNVEFRDEMRQIVFRETRSMQGVPPVPLTAGESRAFELSFDHVPSSWNMQQPVVTVTYLQLAPSK